jgi:PAS domain S-box-containing protein
MGSLRNSELNSVASPNSLTLQSLENFRTILNATTDSYILCDSRLKLLACNNAYLKLHKQFTSAPASKNFNLKQILSPDRKKQVLEYIDSGLKGKEIEYEVFYGLPVNQWFHIHIYPIKQPRCQASVVCICIKNITEKKAFEKKATDLMFHEKSLFQRATEALMLLDHTNTIISYNSKAEGLMKEFMGKEIYKGLNLLKAVPAFRRYDLANKLAEVFRGNFLEYEVSYPDNSWLWVSLIPVMNQSDKIFEICVSIRNVSTRKNMEEQLRKSGNEYHSLVNALAEGVIMQTFEKSVLSVNNSAIEILKTPKSQLMKHGFPLPEITLVNKKNEIIDLNAIIRDKVKAGESINGMVTGIQRENEIQWLHLNIEPVYDGDNITNAYVLSMTDVTTICEYVNELTILSKVVTEASNLITITDSDEKIMWANETFLKTTGYSLEEVINKKPGGLLGGPEKDRNEVARIKAALSSGVPVEGELLNYGKGGKIYWVHYNIHPVKDENGKIIRFFSIQTDITEKKRLQENLRHSIILQQKALMRATLKGQEKERNELGKELHDNINQILAAAKLSLDCSLNGMENNRDFIVSAFTNVKLAMEDIRRFSHRLVSPHFQQSSFGELIQELVFNLQLSEITDIVIEPGLEKIANPDLKLNLFRIVQEQLNNIVKHAKATSIRLSLGIKKNIIMLTITDNGVGFQKKTKKKGIGIKNIYNRAESFNGTVQIKSSPANGCILQVAIPI